MLSSEELCNESCDDEAWVCDDGCRATAERLRIFAPSRMPRTCALPAEDVRRTWWLADGNGKSAQHFVHRS
jgi:hypothetical protein